MNFGLDFLSEPDLFPRRHSGEAWGTEGIGLRFPGGPFWLTGLSPGQRDRVATWFGDVVASEKTADGLDLTVFRAHPEDFREVRLTEYRFDLDSDEASVRIAGPGFMALFDVGTGRGASLWIPPEVAPGDLEGTVENVLRVVAAYRVLSGGGALLHSACVVNRGRAHLFLGHSGAGKSTVSTLSATEGRAVLSDDINVLERREGHLVVSRMPFAGDFGRSRQAGPGTFPLAALYRLRKGPAVSLAPLSRSEAAALVLACAPFVNADPARAEKLLSTAIELTGAVPCSTLTFPREGPLWDSLEKEVPQ